MANNAPGSGWKPLKITVNRGGRFLRVGDTPSKFGGAKLGRLLPAAWNGQFMRLLRR
jgi:hypothetical protein